jgi:hypothetical protein
MLSGKAIDENLANLNTRDENEVRREVLDEPVGGKNYIRAKIRRNLTLQYGKFLSGCCFSTQQGHFYRTDVHFRPVQGNGFHN